MVSLLQQPQAFALPADGWYHISAVGEFPHNPTGLVQVIDRDSLAAIVQQFAEVAGKPNFPGVLIDFDHSSLDLDKPTEAAGWIVGLQERPNGLWAKVRWSDRGEEAVRGGRYRFVSPVWRQEECLKLGENRIRPTRLYNCALTNDPNIRGMVPLANSARPLSDEQRKAIFAKSGRGGGFRSKRDSDARIAELRRQRDEIESLRTPPPEAKDFDLVNLRQMKTTMLRAGQELNDITAALARAAETNRAKKQDIQALKRQIREQYKDPAARKRALERQMAGFEKDHARATQDWEEYNRQIDAQVRRIDAKIREEEIVGEENNRAAESREARASREEEERARKAEIAAEKEQRRLLERAAQEQARQERAEARKAVAQDPARLYRSELVKRRTYWEALKRGDTDQARRMYPQADHDRNLKDLDTLRPKSGSKMQEAVFDGAFAKLKYEAP